MTKSLSPSSLYIDTLTHTVMGQLARLLVGLFNLDEVFLTIGLLS